MGLYPHNQVVYNKVFMMLAEHRRCALVQGTGTGKTFVLMELLRTLFNGMRVMMVVPEETIIEGILLYDDWDFDVKFVTYEGLKKIEQFDGVLVLDELHRAGARSWNREVIRVSSTASYVFGMTATEYRYLDNRRDMAKELFGECVVYGPSYDEAIQLGILAAYDYYAILSDVEEYKEKLSRPEVSTELKLKVASLHLDEYQLTQRVRSHIDEEHRKWVVFFPTVAALEGACNDVRQWFYGLDVNIYKVYNKQSKANNRRNIQEFNADTGYCAILSVDMLNEGVHLNGVTGVIFARRTVSGNVFIQQMGRGSSTKNVRIRYLDLVRNFDNVKALCKRIDGARARVSRNSGNGRDEQVDAHQVLVCYDELLLQLEDIMAKAEGRWSDYDDDVIRAYYPLEGSTCWLRIPYRTKQQVIDRARMLGVTKNRRWTPTEDFILRLYYRTEGDAIWKRLPSRSSSAINARARKLNLVVTWSQEEDLILFKHFAVSSLSAL
ncbi:MAG: DEAD/DEAH box helicase family protein, partial [Roseburia sp.]|nr:DEAD/DEAH box helicase family protein [Roseburia sp.]